MNAEPDVERLISGWLHEEAPGRAPDRILERAGRTIDRTHQRRFVAGWREFVLGIRGLAAAAVIGALVVAGVAVFALRPSSNFGGPGPSGTPTLAPSPSPLHATRPPGIGTSAPYFPSSPLPDPLGKALPADLIGRTYEADPPEVQETQRLILTLRSADDPHCAAMFEGRSTRFTYLWTPNYPKHITDPAARGSARIVDGRLVLSFDLVPNDPSCVGQKAVYVIESAGETLKGVNPPACTAPGFLAVTVPAD